jgi:hypothetical protein
MSWFEWWVANLLQGSVGALIGLLGLFAVFWFTVRHERSLERVRMAEHDKRLEREHTAVSAAEVVKASHAFQWPPADLDRHATTEARASALIFDRHAKTEALASALILMCVREAGTHPKASEWANRESRLIIELAHSSVDIRAGAWEAGGIGALMAGWAAAGFTEEFRFPPVRLKDHEDVPPERTMAARQADPDKR